MARCLKDLEERMVFRTIKQSEIYKADYNGTRQYRIFLTGCKRGGKILCPIENDTFQIISLVFDLYFQIDMLSIDNHTDIQSAKLISQVFRLNLRIRDKK